MRKLSLSDRQLNKSFALHFPHKPRVRAARISIMQVGFLAMVGLLLVRLVFVQLVHGGDFLARSQDNRIFIHRLEAPRGLIYDRYGEVLADNKPVLVRLADEKGNVVAEPVIVEENELETWKSMEVNVLDTRVSREYVSAPEFAHVLGYVREADQKQVDEFELRAGEVVGAAGVESFYDASLRGVEGRELIEVDAMGKILRRAGEFPAEKGDDLTLSLDSGLQRAIFAAFGDQKGAAVVTDPNTGEVLSMVSAPSYDSNWLSSLRLRSDPRRNDKVTAMINDEDRAMVNRSVSGVYPPGSVFKVVPAAAGLETEVIDLTSEIEDDGVIKIDEFEFRNWFYTKHGRTDGMVNVTKALQRSNDIYFYRLGEKLGAETLADWSTQFGLGQKTGVDLPSESVGLVPSPLWKERTRNERWFLGNTYHFSIGQGDLLTTPLQVNQMFGVVANGGRVCTPSLAKLDGKVDCKQVGVAAETLRVVREGLVQACERGGTGWPFFDFDLSVYGEQYEGEMRNKVACKTGTAQFIDPEDRTHAWFSVFAPAVNPEILVTVLVEAGGEGSDAAAPIAKEALEYWFSR